tara:strand:- start:475 stop:729 length:255 start_codon:yes stop_codon:yes gene_type:complete
MNRKERRAAAARRRKGDPEQAMTDKIAMFNKLPKQCSACEKTFDKQSKDMVFSWKVVVMGERVSLFCPECIRTTQEVIKENSNG